MKRLVSFFEIPAADFNRAISFYEALLNVKLSIMDCETEKMAFFPKEEGGGHPGAISFADSFKPVSGGGVLVSLYVEDIAIALATVNKNGGKVLIPKTKILSEEMGYFAVFVDSEGNQLGLYADK